MYHGINTIDLIRAIILRTMIGQKKEVQKTLKDLHLTFVSTRLHVDMDITILAMRILITENCKYYNIIITTAQYYYIKVRKYNFCTYHNFSKFYFRCTCNDRDICVFSENKSAQMTYVFRCQERTSSNENLFLFPSSFNGR